MGHAAPSCMLTARSCRGAGDEPAESDPMVAQRWLTVRAALLLSAAGAASAPHTAAQEVQDTAAVTVVGTAVNAATGKPVPEVVVVVRPLGLTFVTDAEGRFVIAGVRRGVYALRLIHQDYRRLDGDLTIDRPGEFSLGMTPVEGPGEGMMTGIVGVVIDHVSGKPVSEVVVNVPGAGQVTVTDADGRFSLPDLLPGRHEVAFSHLGYQPRSELIEVRAGHATKVQVVLPVDAIALEPIEVTVDRRDRNLDRVGFYQREEDGWGEFVDREDIETWNPIDLTGALIRFPGVAIVSSARSPIDRRLRFRRGRGVCSPTVYLDGVMLTGLRAFSINDIVDPMSVAGIEMYRGVAGIPVQYSGLGTDCGVVLIWLRRGG